MKRRIYKIFILLACIILSTAVWAQDDEIPDNLTQKQWEAIRDILAIEAIKMLARTDTLNLEIDSLNQISNMIDTFDCEKELYTIVDATKEQVSDFRRKFDETEKKISKKIGTPDDARKMYFEEISNSKIKCLPEFSERYSAMMKKLEPWESEKLITSQIIFEGAYIVLEGDYLWKISELKYSTPYLWPAIWDANRNSIINPNLIFPGQTLKIPSVSEEQRKDAIERSKNFRRHGKSHPN
ncbi:MAG: LysM peptidoglycan-binding domain-containing protein [Chlorobi bacterium]|nr:LysM peptidoglycan-binding domain-containing protein [Chlorobiota bacterium]MCI0716998.1 LysM peptidoglycan-binding domain-containing protein [Chlorobiota bacterium]